MRLFSDRHVPLEQPQRSRNTHRDIYGTQHRSYRNIAAGQLEGVVIGNGIETAVGIADGDQQVSILSAKSSKPLTLEDRKRIENWFQVRVKSKSIHLLIEAPNKAPASSKRTRRSR